MCPHKEHCSSAYTRVHSCVYVHVARAHACASRFQKWSWKTMGLENPGPMTKVPNPDASHEKKEVPLVTVRPLTEDIGPSVTEGRNVKLSAVMYFG